MRYENVTALALKSWPLWPGKSLLDNSINAVTSQEKWMFLYFLVLAYRVGHRLCDFLDPEIETTYYFPFCQHPDRLSALPVAEHALGIWICACRLFCKGGSKLVSRGEYQTEIGTWQSFESKLSIFLYRLSWQIMKIICYKVYLKTRLKICLDWIHALS